MGGARPLAPAFVVPPPSLATPAAPTVRNRLPCRHGLAFGSSAVGATAASRRPTPTAAGHGRAPPVVMAKGDGSPSPPSEEKKANALSSLRDLVGGLRQLSGLSTSRSAAAVAPELDSVREDMFLDDDRARPPEVLVVGATGETGRIIVRKLVLRGFRVRVLVRDLYSRTLDTLGTGVSFVKGDLRDADSLIDAVTGVDKIVCAVNARDAEAPGGVVTADQDAAFGDVGYADVEYGGVARLVRAFHDARHQQYGKAESSKITLFQFGNQSAFDSWTAVQPPSALAEMGLAARPARVAWSLTGASRAAFLGQVFDVYEGVAEAKCTPRRYNLAGFSGLVLRVIGNGKRYRLVLRTRAAAARGVQYVATFGTIKNKWLTVRLPFSEFVPYAAGTASPWQQPSRRSSSSGAKDVANENMEGSSEEEVEDGGALEDVPELIRGDIVQMAVQYAKPEVAPEKDDGQFYLAMDHIKAYRTQEEPEFVLLSSVEVSSRAAVAPTITDVAQEVEPADSDRVAWKARAEDALRLSGLTYTIVRAGAFTEQPGGQKALSVSQDVGDDGGGGGTGGRQERKISRADVAEVCVKALLDPRACNLTFDAFESMYAPTAQTPSEDISVLLGRLRPNT
ncbi:hypothetical protein MMPV_006066 [Pyropia vietnamensis]